ncbi:hypothetical protein COHA_008988 [Chlorella ohadii]|uniref:Uncharacterized protein n=1 Tax=Chlorella ohadii TaxID=2649997 RepID=A0AAD5DKH1_9CHLO|nr:hypothetical protein COHA_008988 [Chlorella ohadii]
MGQFDSRMDQFESGLEALYDVKVAAVPDDRRRRVNRQPAELAAEGGLPSDEAAQPGFLPTEPGCGSPPTPEPRDVQGVGRPATRLKRCGRLFLLLRNYG